MKKVSQHDDLDAGHGRSCLGLMMVVVSNLVGGARQSMTQTHNSMLQSDSLCGLWGQTVTHIRDKML